MARARDQRTLTSSRQVRGLWLSGRTIDRPRTQLPNWCARSTILSTHFINARDSMFCPKSKWILLLVALDSTTIFIKKVGASAI